MGLNIGNTTIGGIYLGNTKISEAYLGSTKIYSVAPPGPTFDYVTIGSQIWMSKNLAIDDGQGGIYTQTVDYGQGNVVEYYYTWAAALRIAASISGWHLPTKDEWTTLATTAGTSYAGTKLKSTYGWTSGNGTDDYGFGGFPAGWHIGSEFYDLGKQARFWTSTEQSTAEANYKYLYSNGATIDNGRCDKSAYHNCVRLVKD